MQSTQCRGRHGHPGVLTEIANCDGEWCEVEAGRTKGYVHQSDIWGAYPGEVVSD